MKAKHYIPRGITQKTCIFVTVGHKIAPPTIRLALLPETNI